MAGDLVVRLLIGFGIAALCTPAGISGAFLLLPIQVQVLDVPSPKVTATNLLFNVVSAPAGAVGYYRRGALDGVLARALCIGTVPAVVAGSMLRVTWLADPARFGAVAGVMLVFLGARTLVEVVRAERSTESRDVLPPMWRLAAVGTIAGLLGGVYGIGGAALVVPWLTTVERLPVSRVAGAGLVTTTVTSVVGAASFALAAASGVGSAAAPDWSGGIALGVGGLVGALVGAWLQPHVPVRLLRSVLGTAAVVAGARMWW